VTLYVESNFVIEITLGQEDSSAAARLLLAAESGVLTLAIPAFSLSEPFATLTNHRRKRADLRKRFDREIAHLSRSSPHRADVSALNLIPDALARIDRREDDRLTETIERLLASAQVIETVLSTFRRSQDYRRRYGLEAVDAIVFATIVGHLQESSTSGPHIFANRDKGDFTDPGMMDELAALNCSIVDSFSTAAARLGLPLTTV
jgi:predicted nucleic acid-binding protein